MRLATGFQGLRCWRLWRWASTGVGAHGLGEILTVGLTLCIHAARSVWFMAETFSNRLLDLGELCETIRDRWLSVTGLAADANACVFAARVLRVVAERQKVPFVAMACTTSIHTVLPDVDNPPTVLDSAVLSVVEPGVWPWHIVAFLGTGVDAWVLDLTAGQFGSVWPVHPKPGPVVRGPTAFDVVFENDVPIVVIYAEAGVFVLHQVAQGSRSIDLGVFDNELEIAERLVGFELSC